MKNNAENIALDFAVPAPRPSALWLLVLLSNIVLIGLPGCLILVPFILLGRLCCRPLELFAGRCAMQAIRLMLNTNPWLWADVDLRLPWAVGRRDKPYITVSNHRSHLDAFFLIAYIPNIRLMAKRTLWHVPFLGQMMWVMKQIPIEANSLSSYQRALQTARRALRKGDPVHFFPETTRCPLGFTGTQKFTVAAFQLAMQEKIPVMPLVFVDTDKAWPKKVFGISFRERVVVKSMTEVLPENYSSARQMMLDTKRIIDAELKRHYDA